MRSRRLLLAAILVVCVVGRGAYVLSLVHSQSISTTSGDTPSYLGPAKQLIDHGRFDSASAPARPEFVRTPGYPAFIAAVYRVFGESNAAVLLVQVALSAMTVLLAYFLAARMWSVPIGLLAAVLTTLEPSQNFTASLLLTESVGALLLITVAAVGFAAFERDPPRPGLFALLGLAIASSTLLRPVTYYLPLLVVMLILVRHVRHRDRWVDLAKIIAAFLVPLVVLIGGWQFRNHERVDSWRFSGIEAKNLYLFRAAGVVARDSGTTLAVAQHRLREAFGPLGTESQGSYYGRMYRSGTHILASHPIDALVNSVDGLRDELFGGRITLVADPAASGFTRSFNAMIVVSLIAFYAICAYGVVLVVRERRDLVAHAFVVGTAVYILLVSAGPEAIGGRGDRFRAPIVPILILYAARGTYELYTSARRDRSEGVTAHAGVTE